MQVTWQELKSLVETYLCPAGAGVHNPPIACAKKQALQSLLYAPATDVTACWKESLNQLPLAGNTILLGIPSDRGSALQKGAHLAPLYLREALLQSGEDLPYFDIGDVKVNPHLLHDEDLNGPTISQCQKSMYNLDHTQLPVSPLSITEDFSEKFFALFPAKKIFALGGDHSISYPLLKTYLAAKNQQGKKTAIIQFSAHSGLAAENPGVHVNAATWLTPLLPALETSNLCFQIGLQDIAKREKYTPKSPGVFYYSAQQVKDGPSSVALEIIQSCKNAQVDELYVSFDIAALHADYAGATGNPSSNGLSPHEPMVILQELFESFPITGADMLEIAPLVKATPGQQLEPETTLMVAAALATFLIQALARPHE